MKKKTAFSLVEILISLIIISCIMAAFVPVITKKMTKSLEIKAEVGGGSAEGDESDDEDGPYKIPQSQEDCNPYYALFVPASLNGLEAKNVCVTRYNAGDTYGPALPSGITIANYKDTTGCTATDGSCCWQGNYSVSGSFGNCIGVSSQDNLYDGCTRTTCETAAANKICSEWAPSGMEKGMWRLPTGKETTAWMKIMATEGSNSGGGFFQIGTGQGGLQMCAGLDEENDDDETINSMFHRCSTPSDYGPYCYKNGTSVTCKPSVIYSPGENLFFNSATDYTNYDTWASDSGTGMSVRCVAERVPKSRAPYTSDVKTAVTTKYQTTATTTRVEIPITPTMSKIRIVKMISSGGDGGAGYMSDPVPVNPTSQDDCPAYSKFFAVSSSENACFAKWNIGDSSAVPEAYKEDFTLPTSAEYNDTSYTIYSTTTGTKMTTSCNLEAESVAINSTNRKAACCWTGDTGGEDSTESDNYTDGAESTYSGLNRTLCTYHAARILCESWAPTGTEAGDWVLPTTSIPKLATLYGNNAGADGFQLCGLGSPSSSYYHAICSRSAKSTCRGTNNGYCYPYRHWLMPSSNSSAKAPYLEYDDKYTETSTAYPYNAFSVRCYLPKARKKMPTAGGGGASGSILTEKTFSATQWKWHVGGKIILDTNHTDKDKNITGAAVVLIQAKNGKIASGYMLARGKNGDNASEYREGYERWGDGGDGGTCSAYVLNENYGYAGRKQTEDLNWDDTVTCTNTKSGSDGSATKGGKGASFVIDGTTYSGASGGTSAAPNGQDGADFGVGGGGGFANSTTVGVGGKGGPGYIEVEVTEYK